MSFETHRDPGGASTWRKPESSFEIRELSRTVTLSRIVGVIDDDLARIICTAHDEILAGGSRPHTFQDWSGVVGYSPGARKILTVAVGAWRGRLGSVHILFSSRLLAMGISVANAVLGGFINAYGDPEKFRVAMARELRGE